MKLLFILSFLVLTIKTYAFSDLKVGGTITIAKSLENRLSPSGALFIFAKKAGANAAMANGQPPMAVLKIVNPKFPQTFSLTPANVMIAGTKFEGPMKVMARYSPNGDAISSPNSLEASTAQNIEIGNNNVKIELKPKK